MIHTALALIGASLVFCGMYDFLQYALSSDTPARWLEVVGERFTMRPILPLLGMVGTTLLIVIILRRGSSLDEGFLKNLNASLVTFMAIPVLQNFMFLLIGVPILRALRYPELQFPIGYGLSIFLFIFAMMSLVYIIRLRLDGRSQKSSTVALGLAPVVIGYIVFPSIFFLPLALFQTLLRV